MHIHGKLCTYFAIVLMLALIAIPICAWAEDAHMDLFPVCKGDFWTYVDQYGNEVWPYHWKYCGFFRGAGYALVCTSENEYGILSSDGSYVVYPIKHAEEGAELGYYGGKDTGVIWLNNGDKYAFFDVASGFCSEYSFDSAQDLWFDGTCSHLLRVTYDGEHYGYVDRTNGRLEIPCLFQQINTVGFHNGYAVEILSETDDVVILHENGDTFLLPCSISPVEGEVFECNLLLVYDETSKLYGYCNPSGICVISPQFDNATSFSDGYASVCCSGKWGHIDEYGRLVSAYIFDSQYYFQNERALAVFGGKNVIIDLAGQIIARLADGYQYLGLLSQGIVVYTDGSHYGLIDVAGNILLPLSDGLYMDVYQSDVPLFTSGIQPVMSLEGKWGYIDTNGTVIIPCVYECASPVYDGIVYVKTDEGFKLLNPFGTKLW